MTGASDAVISPPLVVASSGIGSVAGPRAWVVAVVVPLVVAWSDVDGTSLDGAPRA